MLLPLVVLSTNLRKWRRFSRSVGSSSENLIRTPNEGLLLVTIPVRMRPLIQIFPLASQRPISTLTPEGTGVAVSTKHPPSPVLARFPQTGTAELLRRSSTATKHFMRVWRRRSWFEAGVNISGSKGGLAAGLVATGDAGADGTTGAEGATGPVGLVGWTFEAAGTCATLPLMLRMASSRAWSRFSGAASR